MSRNLDRLERYIDHVQDESLKEILLMILAELRQASE